MFSDSNQSEFRRYINFPTMASSPLRDLTENFFLCSVCLDQFKEPKLLPCLHRYCSDCLDKIISNKRAFECPICKKKCEVPKDGVDGFKTDFHMKSMLEFIQLQKSFDKKDLKLCAGCSQNKIIYIYCFKCQAFLCDSCGQYHTNNILFREHRQHILNLNVTENKELLLEKLATLTKNPRCHYHVEQEAQLCCTTCGNMPVCVTCLYGKHKGHDLHDVIEVAEREMESLKIQLVDMNTHKDKLYGLPNVIDQSITKLKENVRNESEKINLQYEQQMEKIKEKLKQRKAEREEIQENIKKRKEKGINEMRRKHEEEVNQLECKYDQELNAANQNWDKLIKELESKLEELESKYRELTSDKEEKSKQKEFDLQEILQYCEQIIKRYENFTATTSCILDCNDKWADAQSIPDIRAASEFLLEEMKMEIPKLESLSNFQMDSLNTILVDDIVITDKYKSVIDVEGFLSNGLRVNSVTNVSDGNMVVTGNASDDFSHITVINEDGKLQRQDKMKRTVGSYPYRYCCKLSEFRVATVSKSYEVGVYDIRDGLYNSKNIKRNITNCDPVKCVTVDPVKDHIMVSTGRKVHVFDNEINYVETIQLPNVARNAVNISVHGGNLLVCSDTGSAYTVTIDKSSQALCEFTKPKIKGGQWKPFSVCTDRNGYIFILWRACVSGEHQRILVQYSQNDQQEITQVPVDGNSVNTTTIERDGRELLVVATRDTGKLFTYDLIEK